MSMLIALDPRGIDLAYPAEFERHSGPKNRFGWTVGRRGGAAKTFLLRLRTFPEISSTDLRLSARESGGNSFFGKFIQNFLLHLSINRVYFLSPSDILFPPGDLASEIGVK